jgi:hypothetical protein
MAADLEASRGNIEASRRDLADVNVQLEQRTRHIETILESVPSAVFSLDASRHILHANQAARRLLRLAGDAPDSGQTLHDLFPAETVSDLEHLLRKADRMGTTTSQMEIVTARVSLNVAVTVASLDPPSSPAGDGHGRRMGYVMVFEDLTDLLRAQKQTAWREVARRIAHEIKKPSARRWKRSAPWWMSSPLSPAFRRRSRSPPTSTASSIRRWPCSMADSMGFESSGSSRPTCPRSRPIPMP